MRGGLAVGFYILGFRRPSEICKGQIEGLGPNTKKSSFQPSELYANRLATRASPHFRPGARRYGPIKDVLYGYFGLDSPSLGVFDTGV